MSNEIDWNDPDNRIALRQICSDLTAGNRAYLILRLNGLTDIEIAALILALAQKDVSIDALRNRASRIRKEIRTQLEG